MSARPVAIALALMSLAIVAGCQGKQLANASNAQLTMVPQAAITPPPAAAAPASADGEQTLDTNVRPAPAVVSQRTVTKDAMPNGNPAVRTVADEDLPKWVPKRGRLTVVSSHDLAENLGLVPKGSSKKASESISVADKLAEESAARRTAGDPMTQGTSWSYSRGGRVTNHRF